MGHSRDSGVTDSDPTMTFNIADMWVTMLPYSIDETSLHQDYTNMNHVTRYNISAQGPRFPLEV